MGNLHERNATWQNANVIIPPIQKYMGRWQSALLLVANIIIIYYHHGKSIYQLVSFHTYCITILNPYLSLTPILTLNLTSTCTNNPSTVLPQSYLRFSR